MWGSVIYILDLCNLPSFFCKPWGNTQGGGGILESFCINSGKGLSLKPSINLDWYEHLLLLKKYICLFCAKYCRYTKITICRMNVSSQILKEQICRNPGELKHLHQFEASIDRCMMIGLQEVPMSRVPELRMALQRIADVLSVLMVRVAKEEEDTAQQYIRAIVPQVNIGPLPWLTFTNNYSIQEPVEITGESNWEDCFKFLEQDLARGVNPLIRWKDRLAGLKSLRYSVKRNMGILDRWVCESRALVDLIYDAEY